MPPPQQQQQQGMPFSQQAPQQHHYGLSGQSSEHYSQGASGQLGPTPPPLPPNYQHGAVGEQAGQPLHSQYSSQPPSHHYDPQSQYQASAMQSPQPQGMPSSQGSTPYSQNMSIPPQNQFGQPPSSQGQRPQMMQNNAPAFTAPHLQGTEHGPLSQGGPQQPQTRPQQQQLQSQPAGQYGMAPPMPLSSPPPLQSSPWSAAAPQGPASYQGSNPSPQTGHFPAGPAPIEGRPPTAQQYQQPQAQQPQAPERKKFTYIPPGTKPLQQQASGIFDASQMISGTAFNPQPHIQQPTSWSAQNQQSQGQQLPPSANNQWQPVPTPAASGFPQAFPPQSQNPPPNQSNTVQSPQTYQQSQPGSNIGNWQSQGGMTSRPGQGQNQGWDQRQSNNRISTDSAEYQHIHQDSGSHIPANGTVPVQEPQVQASQVQSHLSGLESQGESKRPVLAVRSDLGHPRIESPQPLRQAPEVSQVAASKSDNVDESSKRTESPTISPTALGSSALGGALGPSDWEHFGAYDSDGDIDDTETFGAKEDTFKPVSNNALNVTAELPSAPSPPPRPDLQRHSSSRISSEPDIWPTPPMPVPLQPNRPVSTAESIEHVPTPPLSQTHYAPTPPPRNEQPWGLPERAASVISFDAPNAPSSRPANLVSNMQQPLPLSHVSDAARDSSLHDDTVSRASLSVHDGDTPNPTRDENPSAGFDAETQVHAPAGEPISIAKEEGISSVVDRSVDMRQPRARIPTAPQSSAQVVPVEKLPTAAIAKSLAMDRETQTEMEEQSSHDDKAPGDPYAHLDPWYRDSLSRFANALQQEARTNSDHDRKKIFTEFMMAESSLRGIPYDPDSNAPGQDRAMRAEDVVVAIPSASTSDDIISKSVENDGDYSPGGRPRHRASIIAPEQAASAVQHSAQNQPGRALSYRKPIKAYSIPVVSNSTMLPQTILESPTTEAPIPVERENSDGSNSSDAPKRPELHQVASSESQKYMAYTPPAAPEAIPSPNLDFPNFKDSGKPEEQYPDFMNDSTRTPITNVAPQPPTKATQSLVGPGKTARSMTARGEHEETFITSPVHGPKAEMKKSYPDSGNVQSPTKETENHDSGIEDESKDQRSGQNQNLVMEEETASSRHKSDSPQPLHTDERLSEKPSLPSQAPLPSVDFPSILPLRRQGPNELFDPIKGLRNSLSTLTEDSAFAKKTLAAWETSSKAIRNQREKERQIRQEEQEEETDRLFSENQIGYSDISALEEEFKRSETERKAQEEKMEYESFVREVFGPVYNQLQADIKLLKSSEAQCFDLMTNAVAGREALQRSHGTAHLVDCMEVFLDLHTKIEFRHSRVLDAIIDRNKRYKRTVVQPLYAAGNITKMKQMEKHFDESEKKAALEASREKLARAQRLMETIEQGTMRGVGENLDYMEEITQAIQQLEQRMSSIKDGRYMGQPQATYQDVLYAGEIMQQLTASSQMLMKSFQTAAQAVNYSSYDVAAVSAKLSNADGAELDRLRKAEQEETKRLDEDLKHRLSVVGNDLETAREQIRKLLPEIKHLGPAMPPETMVIPPTPVTPTSTQDIEHEARMQRALEAAKKRNSVIA